MQAAGESTQQAIARELRRLDKTAELPRDWVERTSASIISELSVQNAQAYLEYLRTLQEVPLP